MMKYDIDFNGFWLPYADEQMHIEGIPIGTTRVDGRPMVLLMRNNRAIAYGRPIGPLEREIVRFDGNDSRSILAEHQRFIKKGVMKRSAFDQQATAHKRPRSYSVTDDEHEQLKQLGGGNASRGLTLALQSAGRQAGQQSAE